MNAPPPSRGAAAEPLPRPPRWQERLGMPLFLLGSPSLERVEQPPPPPELAPFEVVAVPRRHGRGTLSATWYPAAATARGAVLLLPPWLPWGQAYFHRRGRVEALRAAGYHALTADLPGFGASGPPAGLMDRDAEDHLTELERRAPGLPLHVWGVSAGGFWAHPAIARRRVRSAFFEDVSPHLIEWGWRMAPWAIPGYLLLRILFPAFCRYLDMRRHAATLGVSTTYVSGAEDRGVRPEDTRALAAAAGGRAVVLPGAGHLEAIKEANREVLALALETFTAGG